MNITKREQTPAGGVMFLHCSNIIYSKMFFMNSDVCRITESAFGK
jgi:hypothetical protein